MRPSLNLGLPDPEWLTLLLEQREKGKTVTQIANETGMARPSVSMLLNGTYPAKSLDLVTRKHGADVVKLYRDQVLCPHQRCSISVEACKELAGALMSTSNPDRLSQYFACQKCALNPLKGEDT